MSSSPGPKTRNIQPGEPEGELGAWGLGVDHWGLGPGHWALGWGSGPRLGLGLAHGCKGRSRGKFIHKLGKAVKIHNQRGQWVEGLSPRPRLGACSRAWLLRRQPDPKEEACRLHNGCKGCSEGEQGGHNGEKCENSQRTHPVGRRGQPGAWGLGPREWGLGPGAWGLGDREWGLGPGAWGIGNGAWGIGNGAWGLGPGVFFKISKCFF